MFSNAGLQRSRCGICDIANFSPDSSFFTAADPTHYHEYSYYYMTSLEAKDFRRSVPDPFTLLRRRGLGTRLLGVMSIPPSFFLHSNKHPLLNSDMPTCPTMGSTLSQFECKHSQQLRAEYAVARVGHAMTRPLYCHTHK